MSAAQTLHTAPTFIQRAGPPRLCHRCGTHTGAGAASGAVAAVDALVPYEMNIPGGCSAQRGALAGHRPPLAATWPRYCWWGTRLDCGRRHRCGHWFGIWWLWLVGLIAARRGWAQEAIAAVGLQLRFPGDLSAIMLTAVFGAGMVNAIIAIGIYNIPTFCPRHTRQRQRHLGARVRAGGTCTGHLAHYF